MPSICIIISDYVMTNEIFYEMIDAYKAIYTCMEMIKMNVYTNDNFIFIYHHHKSLNANSHNVGPLVVG